VKRLVGAHDCGLVINPEGLRRTIEGAMLHSLSRALHEEVQFDTEKVTSVDWVSHPSLRHGDTPEKIDVVMVNGDPDPDRPDLPHYGAGEAVCKPLIAAVANAVRRSRAGLSDPNRPNGSFLFLGPTGVGKTELCKALAGFLFDSRDAMVRIDMSEYMEKHSVARLIGAPPGYVGYEEGGYLTEAVRRKPYSVILLDEVEKAHPDVFNLLLQVLDDGQLTDGQGRRVDFKNTVLVMTSNLGSDLIQTLAPEGNYEVMRDAVMDVVGNHFRPEFINRIDEAVVFHPLEKDQIRGIADIQLHMLHERLKERDLALELTDAATTKLVDVGYDPVYGARPLKRAIQRWIENPLAQDILSGRFMPGETIVADVQDDSFTFSSR
ncbi:AAA family ATPase, partial [uncultured Thalassolituus sp.]|uniref:AAA family ATPase n=1 Tax=uncultured Thalassolituus sp. TaxID=285273 RepID=UPI00263053AE